MGRLHPEHFPLRDLDFHECQVVEALRDFTDDEWIIMPTVMLGGEPPAEIDVVVAHPEHGFAVLEVKGWRNPKIVNGDWVVPYKEKGRGPVAQLRDNRYRVRSLLREVFPHVDVDAALVFTEVRGIAGDEEPSDIDEDHIFWSHDIDVIDSALMRVMKRGRVGHKMFTDDVFEDLVAAIRPNVIFESDSLSARRRALEKLNDRTVEQLRALERLDVNRRVYVSGGAGSGKSTLASSWALRALRRDERVLLVCFNDPLGAAFDKKFADSDGEIVTGSFLKVALSLHGMPRLEPREGESLSTFWNESVIVHLNHHWHEVTEQFDTVIIAEAQDFSPAWIGMLRALLDPEGPNNVLMVGDLGQELHKRGFQPPRPADGWTIGELGPNVRNSREIARLIRSKLNGPPAPYWLPPTTELSYVESISLPEVEENVLAATEKLRDHGFDDNAIAVVCLDSVTRSHLLNNPAFANYENRTDGQLLCDNAHRLKGLEFEAVIVATVKDEVAENVLYVALSRAVHALIVCGPPAIGEILGLEENES